MNSTRKFCKGPGSFNQKLCAHL